MANWGILGLGAIGSLFASKLLESGQPVKAVMDPARLKLNPTQTLKRTGLSGEYEGIIHGTSSTHDIDVLLICVKAYQVERALQQIQLAPHTELVTLHNGMGNEALIRSQFPNNQLWLGTTTHGARRHSSVIEHTGSGQTHIGPSIPDTPSPIWLTELNAALPEVIGSWDIKRRLWQKLAINCAINPLTAIHDCRNGELLGDAYYPLVEAICKEVSQVAQAEGVKLVAADLTTQVLQICQSTAQNNSSMHQDVVHQRATEINAINGYIIACAARHQIAAAVNQQLCELIRQKESAYAENHDSPSPRE
jgi:2-dehydropantoate 2-reductase